MSYSFTYNGSDTKFYILDDSSTVVAEVFIREQAEHLVELLNNEQQGDITLAQQILRNGGNSDRALITALLVHFDNTHKRALGVKIFPAFIQLEFLRVGIYFDVEGRMTAIRNYEL